MSMGAHQPEALGYWFDRPISTLPRETLLEVISHLGQQNKNLRADRARWKRAADPLKYLMDKPEEDI